MSKNLVYVGIAALALIAVVLGYKIYQQQLNLSQSPAGNQPIVPSNNNQSTNNQSATQSSNLSSPLPEPNDSAEQEALIKRVPLPTASLEERIAFNKEVAKYEKATGVITISNCKPSPLILRVKGETQFNIKNNDNVEYQISIGGQKLTLAPNGTATMRAGKADGVTDFSCNGSIQGLVHMHE